MRADPSLMDAESLRFARLGDDAAGLAASLQRQWLRLDAGWVGFARGDIDTSFAVAGAELTRAAAMFAQIQQALQLCETHFRYCDGLAATAMDTASPMTAQLSNGAAAPSSQPDGALSPPAIQMARDAGVARESDGRDRIPVNPAPNAYQAPLSVNEVIVLDTGAIRVGVSDGGGGSAALSSGTLSLERPRGLGDSAALVLHTHGAGDITLGALSLTDSGARFAPNPANHERTQQLPDGRWIITRMTTLLGAADPVNAYIGNFGQRCESATFQVEIYDARGNALSSENITARVYQPKLSALDQVGIPERRGPVSDAVLPGAA